MLTNLIAAAANPSAWQTIRNLVIPQMAAKMKK